MSEAMETLNKLTHSETSSADVKGMVQSFYNAMNDDFNAPILIANLFEAVTFINTVASGNAQISATDLELLKTEMNSFTSNVLGLSFEKQGNSSAMDAAMNLVMELRLQARENKDWSTSDKIRDRLAEAGIVVKDGKVGTSWSVK